jgi:hypothetical protein
MKMTKEMMQVWKNRIWPAVAILLTVILVSLQLHFQGRQWICSCGRVLLWVGDAGSSDTSQHLLDPYSFTHLLHGFLFYWLIRLLFPRLSGIWQLWLAILAESAWEFIENSSFVIQRYREATIALGYSGDTIINSFGDILSCSLGLIVARSLGFRRSLALFALIEVILLFWIRDSLLLNIVMLLYPIEEIKAWQAAH